MTLHVCENKQEWDDAGCDLGAHPLQLWGWGELKAAHNWRVIRVLYKVDGETRGGAQVLVRPLPWPFKALSYIPRGPFGFLGTSEMAMRELAEWLRRETGGTLITAEPDYEVIEWGSGWRKSANTILIPRTLIIDLNKTEEELLAAMTKKTRQYIRKSERDGVAVKRLKGREAVAAVLALYRQTAERAGFMIHPDGYYYDCAEKLGENSVIYGAYNGEQLVSFLWLAISGRTAFELYGGMNEEGQALRANYALKWHAISKCKEWGLERYDMNGLLNDGVSSFKQGFADHEDMLAGTYDYPLSPLYAVWTKALPGVKNITRIISSLRK